MLRQVRLPGYCWLIELLSLQDGAQLRKAKLKLSDQTVHEDGTVCLSPPLPLRARRAARATLQLEIQVLSGANSTISCRACYTCAQLPIGSPYEPTGVKTIVSELASIRRHRLTSALAGTEPPVWIIKISKLTDVELTSFYCIIVVWLLELKPKLHNIKTILFKSFIR